MNSSIFINVYCITLKVKETKLYVRDTSHSQMTGKGIKVSERVSLSATDEPTDPPTDSVEHIEMQLETEMKNKK